MKAVLVLALLACAGFAQASTCEEQATEKKLAGAAKTSFLKKCEREAAEKATPAANPHEAKCEAQATEKKLHGAAKNSFVKKCVKDAG